MKILWIVAYLIQDTPDITLGWSFTLIVAIILDLVFSE